MNEMVERVAAAVSRECWDGCEEAGDIRACRRPNGGPCQCRRVARAAIEAMREPTEAMLEAASGSIARWAWPAMIDAALEDDHA